MYVAVFALVWQLNRMTDFTADDFIYHFVFQVGPPDASTRLLASPLDLFGSIWTHYNTQNGRNLAHAALQFFCLFPKAVFDVVNTLVFLAVGRLVVWHVAPGRRPSPAAELAVFGGLWLFVPYFGQAVLWMSGAVNYLWMSLVTLVTLVPYRLLASAPVAQRVPSGTAVTGGVVALGLIGGSTNENSAGAWILLAFLLMLGRSARGGRIPAWAWLGVVGAGVGLMVQLISPGNRLRAEKLAGTQELTVIERIPYILQVAGETSGVLLGVFVVVFLVARARGPLGRPGWTAAAYVIAGVVSGLAMVVTPTMPHRSWIWTVLFLLIAIGIAGREWSRTAPGWAAAALGAAILVLLGWGSFEYVCASTSISQTHAEVAQELRVIEESKAAGNLDVVVTKFRQPTNRYNALAYTGNLRADPNASFNRWFARYYGLDSITVDNPEEVFR